MDSHQDEYSEKGLAEIWVLLREIQLKLEGHMAEEATYKPQLLEALKILEKSKGAVTFIRVCIYVGGVAAAVLLWIQTNLNITWRH